MAYMMNSNLTKLFRKEATLNSVLYIARNMGGKVDEHKVFKTLYFADMMHLSRYGRSITGDVYIAMEFGPVPSKTYDIFKAVRGDSFFSDKADEEKSYFHFFNKYNIEADRECDLDWLSETDIECLDEAIGLCKDKTFMELTYMSHGLAWNNAQGGEISIKDILRERGESEEYVDYVDNKMKLESAFA